MLIILISTIFSSIGYSQPISEKLYLFKKKNIMFDSGRNWDELSTIKSYRYNLNDNIQLYSIDFQSGFEFSGSSTALTLVGRTNFKKNFYSYIDLNLNRTQNQGQYSSSLELNYSGFGFENDCFFTNWKRKRKLGFR